MVPALYKVYAAILGERLEREVKEKNLVPQNQTGFRKDMGAIDNVYALNYLINRQLSKEKERMMAFFIDLKAAFDSVDRERHEKERGKGGLSEKM